MRTKYMLTESDRDAVRGVFGQGPWWHLPVTLVMYSGQGPHIQSEGIESPCIVVGGIWVKRNVLGPNSKHLDVRGDRTPRTLPGFWAM